MSSIHHPHIIHIYEVFENQEKIVLIMQYASGGELYDYLGCRKKLDENEARRVLRQVASAIFYCHKNHICHRDLKLENILLDDRGNAKIADFGLSNVFDERSKLKTFCGSPLYASPEIVRGTPYCGPEVDCWSLGVLLYTLVYGAMPFDGSNFKRLVKQISEGEYFEPKEKSGASGLIRRLLTVDISLRATIRDICTDWWVNQGYDHSLLKVASDMANLTPVRLDLLLALSSTTSPTAGRSPNNQATAATKPAENRSILSNGYYSKSHPLRIPENGESRRRTLATADRCKPNITCIDNDFGKLQFVSAAGNSQKSPDEQNDRKKEAGCLPFVDTTQTSVVKTLAGDKNENNTLIIVQDLIKDVISKVEQHINNSKMELLRTTEIKLINEKSSETHNKNNNSALQEKDLTGTSVEATNSKLPQSPNSEGTNRNNLLQGNQVTPPEETGKVSPNTQSNNRSSVKHSAGQNTMIQTTTIHGISDELSGKYFPNKTVKMQTEALSDRRKSIPGRNCDLQSRKSSVQLMESDVVIPIFNVCSNIPKRTLDAVKPSSTIAKLNPALKPMTSRLDETKSSDWNVKSNSESLSEREGKILSNSPCSDIDQGSNIHSTDTLCEPKSQVSNGSDITHQNQTATSEPVLGNATVDIQKRSTDTDVPKLPPRKRFLLKIPKLGKSNEKDIVPAQCESDDSKGVHICDKQEDKPPRSEDLELQKADKDFRVTLSTDEKNSSIGVSEKDSTRTVEKEESMESSPPLSERKSRRDFGKRCLSVNSKPGVNREQSDVVSDAQNWSRNKKEHPETIRNISEKELNSYNFSSVKDSETNEVFKDDTLLLQSPTKHDIMLSPDGISPIVTGANISMNVEESADMTTAEKRAEVLETKMGSNLPETEECFRNDACETQNMRSCSSSDVKDNSGISQQRDAESRRSRTLVKSKQRSLSRTRAMSLEFESLALMPLRIIRPPKKLPGKVEIPKTFDPTQVVTSPKAEMREIIFIPTACVSENKEKIQKKIEKVKKAAIVIPPRRKSDAGISSKKKKYTRSKTDFIVRPGDLAASVEDEDLVMDDEQQDAMYIEIDVQSGEAFSPENMDGEAVSSEIWYSAVSPDDELEESEERFKTFDECADSYEGLYNDNDATDNENNKLHRHSVDAESGYWTPPDMTTGENNTSQSSTKMKGEKHSKRSDSSEKAMLQRAAFRNSKMRLKLSDEGLDMCSLSSSLESGIYSWKQEEINGKRISPVKSTEMTLDGSYPLITRSFKKMTFPPEHSSTSELSENFSLLGDTDKSINEDIRAPGRGNRVSRRVKPNGDTKPIKPSDSQSSYGSNDISDDVFEGSVEKEDASSRSKTDSSEDTENRGTLSTKKNNGQGVNARNWQRGETWHSFSTDKESSDNDDDLDLMIDEACQGVYGTEGLWQFLKSVNQTLSNQLKTASKKMSPKSLCHRSKSQESKHPDDMVSQKRPVTRSLSREDKQKRGETQLRHFVSEGKLADADSMDYFEDSYTRFGDTRYSSGYMASGSSLDDSGMLQKDFMSSVDSFNSNSNDISIYGTLRKDKYFQSASALSSPRVTRRKQSLQNPYGSTDMSNLCGYKEDISNSELSKPLSLAEQNRKMSLYGTLRPRHLSQQGKAQSQVLLSTDDGYQLLYNERPKKDFSLETRHGSLGTLSSSVSKGSSELNVSLRENTIKDYEKLFLSDPKNISGTDSTYHPTRDKVSSTVKKIVPEKANRRVSFSSDVKASKSDYHSSIRQNSLNKVREANEELLGTSTHKSNTYEEEQDSGSLLEALKTYGYRGIMSQKLQSTTDRYEQQPRLNYRLPTECFLSTGVCNTDWDNFEYIPVENTFAYQQAIYSPIDPMEYYPGKTFVRNSQVKRNIVPLSCDDDITFSDILRSHRVSEEDFFSPRKPSHKFPDRSDVHLTHREKYSSEIRDTNLGGSARKKSFDSTGGALSNERRNSASEKNVQNERERDKEVLGSADVSEPRGSKQTENSIEILSEKIQALKSRCQRKDENKLKKDIDDSDVLVNEAQGNERTLGSETEKERRHNHADSVDDLTAQEGESSESVSDRIWRKSFYSRFNDVSTTRRKKSSLMDSEFLSGYSSLRNTGKFNVDEEGGVEEPWINTTLKRRNSRRSVPKQTVVHASSPNSDVTAKSECSSVYYKRDTSSTNTEHKISRSSEMRRSLSQPSEEKSKSAIYDKTPFHRSRGESGNIAKVGKNRSNTPQNLDNCDIKEARTGNTRNDTSELTKNSDADPSDQTNVRPPERRESPPGKSEQATNLSRGTDNIPETEIKENGSVATDISKISAAEERNEAELPENSPSPSEKSKTISDKNKAEVKTKDSSSADVIETLEHKPETDKE